MALHVNLKKLKEVAIVPSRQTSGAAGYDLHAAESGVVKAGGRGIVSTGIALDMSTCIESDEYVSMYARIAPRSGLALQKGIDVGAGVIDLDYTGEIKVILFNHGQDDYAFDVGDRVAQLVFHPIMLPNLLVVSDFRATSQPICAERGIKGFGSTG